MADETTPTEEDELEFDPVQIAEEARVNFSLADRLKGIKHRTKKVLIYTDPEAVDRYNSVNLKVQAITDAASKTDMKTDAGREQNARLVAEATTLEGELETLRSAMLETALAIELKAYPNIVVKVARREARKAYADPETKQVPTDKAPEFQEFIDLYLLGESIASVTDSAGIEVELGSSRMEAARNLSDNLAPAQWQRLYDAFINLTMTEAIATAATDDPGF